MVQVLDNFWRILELIPNKASLLIETQGSCWVCNGAERDEKFRFGRAAPALAQSSHGIYACVKMDAVRTSIRQKVQR